MPEYTTPSWPQKPSRDLPLPLAMRPATCARAIGVSERTLWNLTKRGEIPHARVGNKVVIYPTRPVLAWLDEITQNPPVKRPEAAEGGAA